MQADLHIRRATTYKINSRYSGTLAGLNLEADLYLCALLLPLTS